MATTRSDAELDTMLLDHLSDRSAEIIGSARGVRATVEEVQAAADRAGRRRRWDVIVATTAVLALATTAALLVASRPASAPSQHDGSTVVSASPTPGPPGIPMLQPCPAASSSPCVDHGVALVNMWRADGTMSAVTLWLTDASLGQDLDAFTLVFRQLHGDELRVTSILYPGLRTNHPGTSIELSGPTLDHRADQAAAGCSVSIFSLPPTGPLRGTFACGESAYRGGSGTSGFFDASSAPGVAVVAVGDGLFEAALLVSSGSGTTSPSRLDLVYQSPWGYWVSDGDEPDEPMTRVEIGGLVGPGGIVEDPQIRIFLRYLGAVTEIEGCQAIIESSSGDVAQGTFRCPVDTEVLWWMQPDWTIEGTFTYPS